MKVIVFEQKLLALSESLMHSLPINHLQPVTTQCDIAGGIKLEMSQKEDES